MSRSIWKEPFSFLNSVSSFSLSENSPLNFLDRDQKQKKAIEVWSRSFMILPEHIGKDVKIYNGKDWAFRKIVEEMVGHKFGEFCSTKKKTIHKVNKIKQATRKK